MFDEKTKNPLIATVPLMSIIAMLSLVVFFPEPKEAKANPTDQNMTRIVAAEERQVKVLEEIAQLLRKGCRCK